MCGLRNGSVQRRLLAEANLTLKRARDIAQGMEAAERNDKSLKGTPAAVQKLNVRRNTPALPCYRCGQSNHAPKDCRFRDAECHQCKKKGLIAAACRTHPLPNRWPAGKQQKTTDGSHCRRNPQRTRWVAAEDHESGASDTEELQLFAIGERSSRPLQADVLIEGKALRMEIDTGAAVSIISDKQMKTLLPDAILQK